MKEIWKDIEGFDGYYQVSNLSRVRSWKNNKWGRLETPKLILPGQLPQGYFSHKLYRNGKCYQFKRSRLVAKYFVENPNNKPQVNHIDGDKTNDLPHNLEWVTESENRQHAWDTGLHKMTEEIKSKIGFANRGEKCTTSKLTREDVLDIRNAYRMGCFTQKEISNAYNISRRHAGDIINRKRWKHI